ncbi:arginyltransferase [Microvirga alba]|uniref:Aspartate/glutamate leucyltransferase n=1 Tax=Microvirga alba TaxID=2791025 RepID=A0A931BRP7_9HYPH|nr:arginyltransferase [Microvirga alba]MBF9234000.1 arginyltransferase [Microvirga alba]
MTSQPRDAPQFYLTSPSTCPYLPDREERKVFTHIVGRRSRELNEILTQGGFRRSQTIAYRPACDACRACVSVRVLTDEFEPSGNLKRVLKANNDLIGVAISNRPSSEQYSLFRRYLDARHTDGGMADMTVLDYSMMIEDSHVDTQVIEYRRRGIDSGITGKGAGDLIAMCLTDVMSDGLSMVYSFYEPDMHDRSLGTFMILDHIRRARTMGLPYLYLGYWVEGSKKMAYKARFKPQERLLAQGWVRTD